MRPTPAHITALLALPVEARRRLAAQEGPGIMYGPGGASRMARGNILAAEQVSHGWLWLPCDSAAVMEAATPEGGMWVRVSGSYAIWDKPNPDDPDECEFLGGDADPISCALAALAKRA